jgi:hypothetical protein
MHKHPADERRSARANVLLVAEIEAGTARSRVRIANISAHGALVVGKGLPCAGAQVNFKCRDVSVPSWIAWVDASYAGIQFDEAIEPEELLKYLPASGPISAIHRTIQDFRRPGFRGDQLTEEERRIVEAWNKIGPGQT